jgi:hypothetical protein
VKSGTDMKNSADPGMEIIHTRKQSTGIGSTNRSTETNTVEIIPLGTRTIDTRKQSTGIGSMIATEISKR